MALIKEFSPNLPVLNIGDVLKPEIDQIWARNNKGYPGANNEYLLRVDEDPFSNGKRYFRVLSQNFQNTGNHTFSKALISRDKAADGVVAQDEVWHEYSFRTDSNWIMYHQGKLGWYWSGSTGAVNPGTNPTDGSEFEFIPHWFSMTNSKNSGVWPTVHPSGANGLQDMEIGIDTYMADQRQTNNFSEPMFLVEAAGSDVRMRFVGDTDYIIRTHYKLNTPSTSAPYDGVIEAWVSEDGGATFWKALDVQDANIRTDKTVQLQENGFVFFRGGSGQGFEVGGGTEQNTGANIAPQDTWMYVEYSNSYDADPFNNVSLPDLALPEGLSTTNCGTPPTGQIDLSWTPYAGAAANVNIQIQRSLDDIAWTNLGSVASTVSSFSDNTVGAGTTYYYRILAVSTDSSANNSSPTASVNCTTESTVVGSTCTLQYENPNTADDWIDAAVGSNSIVVPDSATELNFRVVCPTSCVGTEQPLDITTKTNTTVADDSSFLAGITGTTYNIDPRVNASDTVPAHLPQTLTHINGTAVAVGVGFDVTLGGETVTFTLLANGTVNVDSTGDIANETVVFRYQDQGTPPASDNETVTLTFAAGGGGSATPVVTMTNITPLNNTHTVTGEVAAGVNISGVDTVEYTFDYITEGTGLAAASVISGLWGTSISAADIAAVEANTGLQFVGTPQYGNFSFIQPNIPFWEDGNDPTNSGVTQAEGQMRRLNINTKVTEGAGSTVVLDAPRWCAYICITADNGTRDVNGTLGSLITPMGEVRAWTDFADNGGVGQPQNFISNGQLPSTQGTLYSNDVLGDNSTNIGLNYDTWITGQIGTSLGEYRKDNHGWGNVGSGDIFFYINGVRTAYPNAYATGGGNADDEWEAFWEYFILQVDPTLAPSGSVTTNMMGVERRAFQGTGNYTDREGVAVEENYPLYRHRFGESGNEGDNSWGGGSVSAYLPFTDLNNPWAEASGDALKAVPAIGDMWHISESGDYIQFVPRYWVR